MRDAVLRAARRVLGETGLNQLVRMEPVLELVREAGGSELLDVGSGSRGLAPWLDAGWWVTALDASFSDYGAAAGPSGVAAREVVGDVRELPFDDASFDVVVAVDLLEHVPAADRERALAELRRVTRGRLIVAGPAGAAALEADRGLAQRLRNPPGWLDEHLENGFPERAQVEAALAGGGALRILPNEHVDAHVRLVRAELSPLAFVPTRLAARAAGRALRGGPRARRAAARALRAIRGRDREPAYRTIVVYDRTASTARQ